MSISLIRATKVRQIPGINVADHELRSVLEAIKENIEVYRGNRGSNSDPLDKAVTVRDLYEAGLTNLNINGILYPGGTVPGGTISPPTGTIPNPTVPPAPTTLTALGALANIILTWDDPLSAFSNYAYTEIWRSSVDDIGTATLIGTAFGFSYADNIGYTGAGRYYWIRFVSSANPPVTGPYNATAGVFAQTGLVGGVDLSPLLITADKIASGAIDLGGTKITGLLADLNLAVISDPTKIADSLIGNTKLANLAVDAAKLANSAVTSTKIANLAVGTAAIATAAITTALIANLAVGSAQIANAAITSVKIGTAAVGSAAIQNLAVTNAAIGLLAVDSAQIANSAIVTAKINNAAITTAKIANAQITNALIANIIQSNSYNPSSGVGWQIDKAGKITAAEIEIRDSSGNIILSSGGTTAGDILNSSQEWAAILNGSGTRPANNADVTNYVDYRVSNTSQSGSGTTLVTNIAFPQGGTKAWGTSNLDGAIVIVLPQSWTNTMLRFTIDIYNYVTKASMTIMVGGYIYSGGYWVNMFAQVIGNTQGNNRVRFSHDGTKNCIVIGTETDVNNLQYPKVTVRDFQAGHSNQSIAAWDTGWDVRIITSYAGYTTSGSGDFSDALLDAKSITNQGVFATAPKLTNANITTYIAGAAIGYALIKDIDAGTITVGTLTGRTIQTASSGKRFVVSNATDHAEFYNASGTLYASIGLTTSSPDTVVGLFGVASASETAVKGLSGFIAIKGIANGNSGAGGWFESSGSTNTFAVRAISKNTSSPAIKLENAAGISGHQMEFAGGALTSKPNSNPGVPSLAADTSGGFYLNDGNGSTWAKIPSKKTSNGSITGVTNNTYQPILAEGVWHVAGNKVSAELEVLLNGTWIQLWVSTGFYTNAVSVYSDGTNVRFSNTSGSGTASFKYNNII